MNKQEVFRSSIKINRYVSDIKDVERFMRKNQEELTKVPLEILNELCGVCGMCYGRGSTTCPIGIAIHKKDNDNVDIKNNEKYSQFFPEL